LEDRWFTDDKVINDRTEISLAQFEDFVRPLLGLSVSLPWKGYGSAIFLELGLLAPLEEGRHHQRREASISFEWDWRVEDSTTVLYGSSNSRPKIEKGISSLQGTDIEKVSVVGSVPELVVNFSNSQSIRSMVMVSGDPQWSIRLSNDIWLSSERGRLYAGDGSGSGATAEEAAMFDRAEAIARRWGTPVSEPKRGNCADCKWFVRLDGALLDFGVCANSASPFDGRVVNCSSGCAAFATGHHF
jgi:Protein of unknown function (DUF3027)